MIVKTRGEKISFFGFTIRGRVKRKDVTPIFIAHQFRTEFIKNQMLEMNGGTNISNLSQEVLSNLKFLSISRLHSSVLPKTAELQNSA